MNRDDYQALRLSFAYDGDQIVLTDVRRVTKYVPPSEPLEVDLNQSGFWYELRAADGKRLYRRLMPHPIRYVQEIFPERPEEPFVVQPVAHPKGVFSFVVPEANDAQLLVLMGDQGPDPQRRAKGVVELAKFDLQQIRSSIKESQP